MNKSRRIINRNWSGRVRTTGERTEPELRRIDNMVEMPEPDDEWFEEKQYDPYADLRERGMSIHDFI